MKYEYYTHNNSYYRISKTKVEFYTGGIWRISRSFSSTKTFMEYPHLGVTEEFMNSYMYMQELTG